MTATTRSRLIKVTLWLVAGILVAAFLRWLGFQVWQYDDAAPLTARAADLELVLDPLESRDLDDGLSMAAFSNGSYDTPLRVYHPTGSAQPRPTLFLIDSMAWRNRSDDGSMFWAEGWARHGFTVVTVTHRPMDIASFPAPAEDVMGAVKFALQLGDDYAVDPARVALMGASAGGHLASYVGYRADEVLDGIDVKAVVNVYGPTDFRYIADDRLGHSWYRIATLLFTPELGSTEDVNDLLGCNMLRRSCRDEIVQASPITYVDGDAPPTMLVQGIKDDSNPWPQARRLSRALTDAGVEVELILDPEMGHELDPRYLESITEFLDRQLGS